MYVRIRIKWIHYTNNNLRINRFAAECYKLSSKLNTPLPFSNVDVYALLCH